MTIDQLKRHVDRRLRAKADKTDVRRLERKMEARFGKMNARFGRVDARLDTIDARLASHDQRFDSIDDKLNSILKVLHAHYVHHQRALDKHEHRLGDLERRHPADLQ